MARDIISPNAVDFEYVPKDKLLEIYRTWSRSSKWYKIFKDFEDSGKSAITIRNHKGGVAFNYKKNFPTIGAFTRRGQVFMYNKKLIPELDDDMRTRKSE